MTMTMTMFAPSSPSTMDLHLAELAAAEEMARARTFKKAWDYYYGKHAKPLKVRPGQTDDNVVVNYTRKIVNAGVSFLFGKDLNFELDETTDTNAEQWLREVWRANKQMTLLQKLALNGGVTGHAFIRILLQPGRPYPRLIVLDPSTVTVRWDPNDIDDVLYYKVEYSAIDPKTGKPVGVRQLIERDESGLRWHITDQRRAAANAIWQTVATATWPHPWAPIVDCQNLPAPNSYWGDPDLDDDVLALNNALNFNFSNVGRIIRFHAHPKTWGRGFNAPELNVAVDETIVLSNEKAELHNLEMQSDLGSSIEYIKQLREALHEIAEVPEVASGKVEDIGNLSGVALAILYGPLLEKTEKKRRTYGDMLVELNRRLLALGGFGEDNRTVLHWPSLLPSDPKVDREVAMLDKELGVSEDTLLQKLGYDPGLEREKREASAQQLGDQLLAAFEREQERG